MKACERAEKKGRRRAGSSVHKKVERKVGRKAIAMAVNSVLLLVEMMVAGSDSSTAEMMAEKKEGWMVALWAVLLAGMKAVL